MQGEAQMRMAYIAQSNSGNMPKCSAKQALPLYCACQPSRIRKEI